MLIKIVYLILIFFGVKYLLNILTKQTNGSDNTYQKSSSNKTYKNEDIVDAEYKVIKDE